MRCKICGRDCPPGAKICRDCASARKRAFAQTVTQPLLAAVGAPTVGEPRFAPKPLRPRAANDSKVKQSKVEQSKVEPEAPRAERPAALPLNVVPRRIGAVWLLGGVVVVAAVALLLLRTMNSGFHGSEDATPIVPEVAMPSTIVTQQVRVPDPAALEPAAKLAHAKAQRKATARVEASNPDAVAPSPAPEPAPVARAPSPPPRAVDAPRSDPWQAMNEGLARCAHEALFDRVGCEQKLRLQYCGNSWGVVPQCPIGPATDHGQ